jgi:hypothetical protein
VSDNPEVSAELLRTRLAASFPADMGGERLVANLLVTQFAIPPREA